MEIIVSRLEDGVPVEVEEEYDPKKLGLELVDLKFLDKLYLHGEIEKQFEAITFRGTLTSRVRRICGRTLQEVDEPLEIDFAYYYSTTDSDVIDTLDDLREAVLMDQPMVYYLPGTENTGKSENETEKDEDDSTNPFRQLKDIRDRLKEE